MAFEANSGLQVMNHYGPRDTGGSVGVERTTKSLNILSVELTGAALVEDFISNFVTPKHAHMLRAFLTVDAPFDITGGTVIAIGEGDSPTTNGISVAVADLQSEGVHEITDALTGTWSALDGSFTERAARLGVDLGGAVVGANAGRATITIEYLYKVRDDTEWEADKATMPAYQPQG